MSMEYDHLLPEITSHQAVSGGVQLRDLDNLLGEGVERGITVALIDLDAERQPSQAACAAVHALPERAALRQERVRSARLDSRWRKMRRESYSNRFATALEGIEIDNPGTTLDRSGHPNPVPRVVGKVRRRHAVEVRDVEFLRANTDRVIKITVPGPFTMAQQAQNDFYESDEELALDYAGAVNEEIKDLFAAGADIVQIDEPYMQARPEKAREYGLKAIARALHICFGYAAIIHERPNGYNFLPELADSAVKAISIETAQSDLDCSILAKLDGKTIILGVLDLSTTQIETPQIVAARCLKWRRSG